MRGIRTACLLAAATLVAPAVVNAEEMKAEVIHWWTSGGESAAIKVFADEFTAEGGEWIDNAIALGSNARAAGLNRIVGGEPPTAMQFNTGMQFDEIVANGFLRDLDDIAAEGKWRDVLPPVIVEATTRDGKFYAVPVNIHGENWVWYNTQVLVDAGVEPPTSYAEMIAAGPKLRDAGVIPLALGGQAWQERLTFYSVLLGEGGAGLYMAVLGENDIEAVRTDAHRQVVETYAGLRDLVDEGSPGRNWNDATNMVITGQAAMQIMGDWAKGEFIAAGQTPGEEYACIIPGEANGYMIGGDVFVFPLVDDPAQQAGQVALATLMMAPETQIAFNMNKGSVPVRLDLDVSGMDVCAQKGMALLADPAKQIPSVNFLASSDLRGALDDVITEFWNTPSMSTNTFVDNFVSAIETAG